MTTQTVPQQLTSAEYVKNLRAMADWVEAHPGLPVPVVTSDVQINLYGADGPQQVIDIAAQFGVLPREVDVDEERTKFATPITVGSEYRVIAWNPSFVEYRRELDPEQTGQPIPANVEGHREIGRGPSGTWV